MRGATALCLLLVACGGRERDSRADAGAHGGPLACLNLYADFQTAFFAPIPNPDGGASSACRGCVFDLTMCGADAGPGANGYRCWSASAWTPGSAPVDPCSGQSAPECGGSASGPSMAEGVVGCCMGPPPPICDGGP
jgi:hypothetical protein